MSNETDRAIKTAVTAIRHGEDAEALVKKAASVAYEEGRRAGVNEGIDKMKRQMIDNIKRGRA